MRLEHSFSVPVPVEVAWQALLDPHRVAPCFPGATLTSVDGDEFHGTVKVRMGPIALTYKGVGRFTTADQDAGLVVLQASGKDSRGNGTASAAVTATLSPAGDRTQVGVVTELTITGRPAQLGRGLIGEIGGRLIGDFASCLAAELSQADETAADLDRAVAETQPAVPARPVVPDQPAVPDLPARPAAAAEEIDLLDLAGPGVARRLAPVLAGLFAVFLVLRWLRRRG